MKLLYGQLFINDLIYENLIRIKGSLLNFASNIKGFLMI